MKNPAYLAPVAFKVWTFIPEYNRKHKAWDLGVGGFDVPPTQPFGGNGYDADNLYPVPYVWKETATKVFIKYHGVGMGDGPWKREYFKTEAAARKAALEWLGDRKEMTKEQEAAAVLDEKRKLLAENRKWLKEHKAIVAKVEAETAKLEAELA